MATRALSQLRQHVRVEKVHGLLGEIDFTHVARHAAEVRVLTDVGHRQQMLFEFQRAARRLRPQQRSAKGRWL